MALQGVPKDFSVYLMAEAKDLGPRHLSGSPLFCIRDDFLGPRSFDIWKAFDRERCVLFHHLLALLAELASDLHAHLMGAFGSH